MFSIWLLTHLNTLWWKCFAFEEISTESFVFWDFTTDFQSYHLFNAQQLAPSFTILQILFLKIWLNSRPIIEKQRLKFKFKQRIKNKENLLMHNMQVCL